MHRYFFVYKAPILVLSSCEEFLVYMLLLVSVEVLFLISTLVTNSSNPIFEVLH